MKNVIFAVSMFVAMLSGSLQAQIYADISISHGGVSLGVVQVRLDYDKAPRTCANFIGLATGERPWLDTTTGQIKSGVPYYDGLTFHRLIHTFMMQGGDPLGTGSGGPGYVFQDEFDDDLRHAKKYVLSMANSGPHSNGSQFFIMLVDNWTGTGISHTDMDNKHSVFGEVISGTSIIEGFTNETNFPTAASDRPDSAIVIKSVKIIGWNQSTFDIHDPSLLLPTVYGVETKISHDPDADTYTATWDRQNQNECFFQVSGDLTAWQYLSNGVYTYPYLLSMDAETAWPLTLGGVTGTKFFSRVAGIDYSLISRAPADLTADGSTMEITITGSETVTLTFDGAGGGSWISSEGGLGSLTSVSWTRNLDQSSGVLFYRFSQGGQLPLGRLQVTFDAPAGSENWPSFDFTVNFHSGTSGWCHGSVPIASGSRNVHFTYTL